jgi:hypothetical protein
MTRKDAEKKAKGMQDPNRVGGAVAVVVIVKYADGEYEAIPEAHLTDASYTGSRTVVKRYR